MNRFFTPRRLSLLALGVLAAAAAMAGCAKKVTQVDANYTAVEGRTNPDARLVVWPDVANNVILFDDLNPPGPPAHRNDPTDDTVLSVTPVFRSGPGTVRAMLLDGTTASGFQLFRKATNGAFEQLSDYVLTAPRKWLESQWELYEQVDRSPTGYTPATYVGRGVVAGEANANSPLSNVAQAAGPPSQTLAYTATPLPQDSLFTMQWTDIPGAAGYWIHVYQFRSDATHDEVIASGSPSPVWNGKVRDTFVGYVTAPTIQYKIGDPGALVLTQKNPLFGQVYLVRITAVDASGQLIAYCKGDTGLVQQELTYQKFLLAATAITPTRRGHTPAFGAATDPADTRRANAFGVPGFAIVPARR